MKYNFKKHINDENNKCMCKLCRMNRALDKEDPEDIKQKRIERAREIVRRQNEEHRAQSQQ